jgi:hypothetical protein
VRRGLRLHAAALLLLLVGLVPLARWQEVFQADEAAALAQGDLLRDGDGWTAPNPSPTIDPELRALPLDNSDVYADGTWAPFAKHPAYAALVGASMLGLGGVGPILLSVLGTLVAAVAAGLLAERLRAGTGPLALWLVGVGSPLLFDSYLVIAHALGAGVAAVLGLGAIRGVAQGRAGAGLLLGLVAGSVLLGLLRTEGLLLSLGLAAALGVEWLRSRPGPSLRLGMAVGGGGLAGFLVDRRLGGLLIGEPVGSSGIGSTGGGQGLVQDRLEAARVSLVEPTFFSGPGRAGLVLGTVLLLAVAVLARRAPTERALPIVAALGAVLVVTRLASSDDPVPGLVVAFPLLPVGLLSLRGDDLTPPARLLAVASGLFALGVAATQYAAGGGGGWGGRYFAIGLPLVVPVAAVGLRRLLDALPPRAGRVVAGSFAAATLALGLLAVTSLHQGRVATGDLVDEVVAASGPARAPVVTTVAALGRFGWEHSVADGWLSTTAEGLPALAARVREVSDRAVLVTSEPEAEIPLLGPGWEAGSRVRVGRATTVVVLVASDR